MQCNNIHHTKKSIKYLYKNARNKFTSKQLMVSSRMMKPPSAISPRSILNNIIEIEKFPYHSLVFKIRARLPSGKTSEYFVKLEPVRKRPDDLPDVFFGDMESSSTCIRNSSNWLFKEIIMDCQVQNHVKNNIATLREWGVTDKHNFAHNELLPDTPVMYAIYDMVPGETLYTHLKAEPSEWPFRDVHNFTSQFLKFIRMLVYLARKADFRHNDLWTKNMYIVTGGSKTQEPEFYLIDLGWATDSVIKFGRCSVESRYWQRVKSEDQIRRFFFANMAQDYTKEVFSYHKGQINELDIVNLLNNYLTIMYLKYPETIPQLETKFRKSIHDNIRYFNNNKTPYHIRLDKLVKLISNLTVGI